MNGFTALRLAGRPADPPKLIDAPRHLAVLFAAYRGAPEGDRPRRKHALIEAMWPYRRQYIVCGDVVLFLINTMRGEDLLQVLPRKMALSSKPREEKRS